MASIPKLPSIEDDDPLLRRVLYAGEKSATADKEALAEAKRRIAAGEDADKVWTDLGWKRAAGAGGAWQTEIDDFKSKIRPGVGQQLLDVQAQQAQQLKAQAHSPIAAGRQLMGQIVKGGTFGLVDPNAVAASYKLGDLIDHPELAKAYPGVMDTPVAIDASLRNLGELQGGDKIVLNPRFIQLMADRKKIPFEDYLREIVLHETQHRIRAVEKWKDLHDPSVGNRHEEYRARSEEAEAFDTELRRDLSAEQRRRIQPGALEALDREREMGRFPKQGPAEAAPQLPPGGNVPMRQADPNAEPAPGAESVLTPEDSREAYASDLGFPDYLTMHFQLLHPSTPPEVAQHHLEAAWGAGVGATDDGETATAP